MTTPTTTLWLATDPPRPCPPVLDEKDAGIFLRIKPQSVRGTLTRYRNMGLLHGVRVGNRMVYRVQDLEDFLTRKAQADADSNAEQ